MFMASMELSLAEVLQMLSIPLTLIFMTIICNLNKILSNLTDHFITITTLQLSWLMTKKLSHGVFTRKITYYFMSHTLIFLVTYPIAFFFRMKFILFFLFIILITLFVYLIIILLF